MIAWICVVAGGPDHERVIEQWVPSGRAEPFAHVGSDYVACAASVIAYKGQNAHAIFCHPDASSLDQLNAEKVLLNTLGVDRSRCQAIGSTVTGATELRVTI